MTDETTLSKKYNYDSFTPQNFQPWLRFDDSPPLGERGPNFSLWTLNKEKVVLSDLWGEHLYTIVEFGSYT